ncbi:GAF domain-containing protein [Motiliproteus sediminis]|uniref:GAF domain-containing protein n=1 Tax=Motiliproteus sediminis TaxID=1468178 RepID=UPI001AF00F77|nr:GAF domain-containing protein [Motiliproteus sediminis]
MSDVLSSLAQPSCSSANEDNFIAELIDLSSFVETQDSLDASLREVAGMVAHLLKIQNCSIMLLKQPQADQPANLRVLAHHGFLPNEAYDTAVPAGEGIAGTVASTGEPLLITEIRQSPFAIAARRPVKDQDNGFISCPLIIADQVIGVMNVSTPSDGRILGQEDLTMVNMIALLVSKSIQVFQLQHLLRSNFIQLALARESNTSPQHAVNQIATNGHKMAKVLAKSFFNEMQQAGFGDDHIITAATEVIGLLNSDLSNKRRNS